MCKFIYANCARDTVTQLANTAVLREVQQAQWPGNLLLEQRAAIGRYASELANAAADA